MAYGVGVGSADAVHHGRNHALQMIGRVGEGGAALIDQKLWPSQRRPFLFGQTERSLECGARVRAGHLAVEPGAGNRMHRGGARPERLLMLADLLILSRAGGRQHTDEAACERGAAPGSHATC